MVISPTLPRSRSISSSPASRGRCFRPEAPASRNASRQTPTSSHRRTRSTASCFPNAPGLPETFLFRTHATLSRAFLPAWKASSISRGGRWPMAPCSRPVLYQMTHCRVPHSNRATDFHGPKNPMTPVLNRPITLSARALSWLSPTLPAEMSIPASARHSV